MAKGLPRQVKSNLEKCREAAIAAVEVYNRPGARFRTPNFLILAIVSWTAFFHAVFYKRKKKPWYKKPGKAGQGTRYVKIDGDPKHWDLSECLKQFYGGNNPPERSNLEFLVGLRNKTEHRELPKLDAGLYGECQASLLNLEEAIRSEFGERYLLADELAISLQFSHLIPQEKKKVAKILASEEAKSIRDYVEKFRAGLPSSTLNSTKYSFNVFLVPKVSNRKELADAAVEFIHIDEANKEDLSRLEKLNVLIKDRQVPIANLGLHRPKDVVNKVGKTLKKRFLMSDHTSAWKHFGCRPATNDPSPMKTNTKYCIYDAVHNDYSYTDEWVKFLLKELSDEKKYELIVNGNNQAK